MKIPGHRPCKLSSFQRAPRCPRGHPERTGCSATRATIAPRPSSIRRDEDGELFIEPRRGTSMTRTTAFVLAWAGIFVVGIAMAQTGGPGTGSSPGSQLPGSIQPAQPGIPGTRPMPGTPQPPCTPGVGSQPCLPSPAGGSATTGQSGLPQVSPPTVPGGATSSQPPLQPCPPGAVSTSGAPCLRSGAAPLPSGALPPPAPGGGTR